MNSPLLEVRSLSAAFFPGRKPGRGEAVPVVRNVSFSIDRGTVLGIVGESGCGKSMTSLSIMGLLPPSARIISGQVLFNGKDMLGLPERELANIRGNRISMIFQDSLSSLNPTMKIGRQLSEVFRIHRKMTGGEALNAAIAMLRKVGIYSPERRINDYPHQLSGGMRQRVMIAMAFACSPELLIADEPTTALDVTIQKQILTEIRNLKDSTGAAVLFITHDFGVMAEMADTLLVMYAGEVVEFADADIIFENPLHPYTIGLLESIPRIDRQKDRLPSIKGTVPRIGAHYQGCAFRERCPFAQSRCAADSPPLTGLAGRLVRCWRYAEGNS